MTTKSLALLTCELTFPNCAADNQRAWNEDAVIGVVEEAKG